MVQHQRMDPGVCAALFIPIRDREKGEGNKHPNNLDWKTFKYLKYQICFSVSLIGRIHNISHESVDYV